MSSSRGSIRIGVGGWTYEPWRETFYPDDLPHKKELPYAAGKLTTIEVNGTYYRSQTPKTFAAWHDETPDGFVFSLKAPRFATNRKVLGEAGESIERFMKSGVGELGDKLGPINWQFMATKKFDPDDFEAFLKLLPAKNEGRPLRHAVEVRHDSFRTPGFVELARKYQVAVVIAGDSEFPQIADLTAPFAYARIMGTREDRKLGYSPRDLDRWAHRARAWASGDAPADLDYVCPRAKSGKPRDVFLYVIAGHKALNPVAAMELIKRLK